MTLDDLTVWVIGLGVPLIGGAFAMWWKVEKAQDKALHELHKKNDNAHEEIKKEMNIKHNIVIDKIERIWHKLSE